MRRVHQIRTILEWATLTKVVVLFVAWLLAFAILYDLVSQNSSASFVMDGDKRLQDFPNALYFSVTTATTLGYGDMAPKGWLRCAAAFEVLGGLVLAGLAVGSISAIPLRGTRIALRECSGTWIERVQFKGRPYVFYAKTVISVNGLSLDILGRNFDPDGQNDQTTYDGHLLANQFPTLVFEYSTDVSMVDYSSGILKVRMFQNASGHYNEYVAESFDEKYGRRDKIQAHKIVDARSLKRLNDAKSVQEEMRHLIDLYFPQDMKI